MKITFETCPVCQTPGMKVEHGIHDAITGNFVHIEHCEECGDLYPIVGYDCENCVSADSENKAKSAPIQCQSQTANNESQQQNGSAQAKSE